MLSRAGTRVRRARRDERGAIVVITSLLTCFVLVVVAALTVDLGNTWARRGQLQTQADNAAIFAASYLPASQPATQLVAAKAAVWYLACDPVNGQEASVNAAYPIPRNSDGSFVCTKPFVPAATLYDAAASSMIGSGAISFPNKFEIAVTTPVAKVQFGFGQVAGAKSSNQQKTATAHVYSPGNLVPMGGSLGCIAAAANSTQLLGLGDTLSTLVPINYFSAGSGANTLGSSSGGAGVAVTWPPTPPTPTGNAKLTVTTAAVSGNNVVVTYSLDNGLTGLLPAILTNITSGIISSGVKVWFGRGSTVTTVAASISAIGTVSVAIPASVLSQPGEWHVKIESPMATSYSLLGGPAYQQRQASNDVTISIGASGLSDLTSLDNFLSCAKPIVSPRTPTQGDSQDMIDNIRRGLDHDLSANPSLVTAAQGLDSLATTPLNSFVLNAVNDPTKLALGCGTGANDVTDIASNATRSPNCLAVNTKKSWAYEFTQGFLTQQGRLSCSVSPCAHASFSGAPYGQAGTYNDDQISDFITGSATGKQSVLDDLLFTSLDTLVTPSIPVLTPGNLISQDLYSSPRFFWAPVLTTVFTTGTTASYPVLTFRPSFITQEQPSVSATQKLINSLAVELSVELNAVISGGITGLLNGTTLTSIAASLTVSTSLSDVLTRLGDTTDVEAHGLVFDNATTTPNDSRLKAVRVMNLNPGSLPAVNPNYGGPVSDYFGSGPKVIRLVR